ncbi:jg1578, partial [Pararge aegeria aegeria]
MSHTVTYEEPKIHRDARVVERRAPSSRKPEFFRHSIADAALEHPKSAAERWHSDTKNSIAAIANKFDSKAQKEPPVVRRAAINRPAFVQQKPEEEPKRISYYKPPPPGYNFAAPQPAADDLSKPVNRFNNNKRSRMKRANTIDIGRPLGGYQMDDDTDEENNPQRSPQVPPFQPQTENDRKFLAFMQKNEDTIRNIAAKQANWSSRFGNIKNNFENRDRQENGRSLSSSSAKRFWQNANENSHTSAPRPRKFLADITPEIVKPPWVSPRRDSLRTHPTANGHPPPPPTHHPVMQSPISPIKQIVKPFVAKPIPVNQFSHAPLSAFKPPAKIMSPTKAPLNIWSPPSSSIPVSPSTDYPIVLNALSPTSHEPSSHLTPEVDKTVGFTMFDYNKVDPAPHKTYGNQQPTPPTHVRPQTNYPIKPIPSQNDLAAPELVKKLHESKSLHSPERFPPKIDARQLQIEFYERQVREKSRCNSANDRDLPVHKPPPPPAYTVIDYTPQNVTSTFIPLQQTPDIEKAKAHKVDYLPDVVMNENNNYDYMASPTRRVAPASPSKP